MGALLYTSAIFFAIIAYFGFQFYQMFSQGSIMDEFKQSDLSSCSYVPETKKATKLETKGFPSGVKFGIHGVDVLTDPANASLLHLFAVSHQENGKTVIEHFTHTLGTSSIEYFETFESADIVNVNDVAAVSPSSFYFTQDITHSSGILNFLEAAGLVAGGRVMFRDESGAYSEVARGLKFANGISLSPDKKFVYVAESMAGILRIYEREEFGDLVLKEKVPLRFSPDNLHVDPASGHIYAAGFPLQIEAMEKLAKYDGAKYADIVASISARISNETGEGRFFGRNYKVEPVFMDDGNQLFSTTVCASDEERGVFLLSGLFTSKGMMDCRMKP